MPATPRSLHKKNMTTAKRSLSLIEAAVAEHRQALDAGDVPADGFAVYVIRYEQALAALRTLVTLESYPPAGDSPPGETGEVGLEDLGVLIQLVRGVLGPGVISGDSPLARVAAVAFPDGLPGDAPAQGQEA